MSDSFDLGEPAQPAGAQPYRVLARKYRPQRFSELIGQDAMVQTLGNAIKRGRIAHAFLMTGVRGVGKTSTARLMAKALNCEQGPTIDPCGVCDACVAITEGRHIDVVEMDAASNTGVDDVREIIEAVRYSAVSARFKVYIIDEVHMLTKNAFNALLKTLEEPPPHVKFLFATTEIQKVPITVLSRCQRFDLRRIPSDMLAAHFGKIAEAEQADVELEALALIARAAEGSVRDGLSILDQAIAHAGAEGGGVVTGQQVRDMLGLSDRGAVRRLMGLVLEGDAPGALAALADQRDLGVEPLAVLKGLLDICHAVTVEKVGREADASRTQEEVEALRQWSLSLSFVLLHRLWQMLLRGHEEVARASDSGTAAEMAILRIIHASQLPDPGDIIRRIENGEVVQSAAPNAGPTSAGGSVAALPADYQSLIALIDRKGKMLLGQQLHDYVGLAEYAPPLLRLQPVKPLPTDFARDVSTALKEMTGQAWTVELVDSGGRPSLRQQEQAAEDAARDAVLAEPIVKAAFDHFPDAELVSWETPDQRSAVS